MTTKKRVFIADKLSEEALDVLGECEGIEVDYRPGLEVAEKLEAVKGARAVIVRSATRVDAPFLEAAEDLELVVRAGVGVDNVDLPSATRRGIVVQNVPDGNVRSAAEHTIALLLALSRNIPQAHDSLKRGKWERSKFVGVEVQGKTLGVVGLGKIGRHVVKMAQGLGMNIVAHDPFVASHLADELGIELAGAVEELVSRCDYLTVHVPKGEDTIGLIGAAALEKARDGLRIVNCARGGIVDEPALFAALESGKVAGAAIDVFEKEPPEYTDLVQHPRVVVTPHLGASTREAQVNVALAGARLVVDFLVGGKLRSPVNVVIVDPELRERIEPYTSLANRLGQLHAWFLAGNPERVVVKYYGKDLDPKAQSLITSAVLEGFLARRCEQPVNSINARLMAQEQGLAVEERSEGSSRYFVNMVKVELQDGSGRREFGGTIRGRRGLRLVTLDNYHFDAVLEGCMLLTANEDRPGMIETLGRVLASHQVNISYMSLGRDRSGGTAISLLNVDSAVPEAAVEDLVAREGILWAKAVELQ